MIPKITSNINKHLAKLKNKTELFYVEVNYDSWWTKKETIKMSFSGLVIVYPNFYSKKNDFFHIFEINYQNICPKLTEQLLSASGEMAIEKILQKENLAYIHSNSLITLYPHLEHKPWGKEIWFTGIEERGQAKIESYFKKKKMNLTDFLYLYSNHCCNGQNQLVLLKILESIPERIFGDLYLELHEKKQETYIITDVNSQIHKMKTAQMKYGLNLDKRKTFKKLKFFKQSFFRAVMKYKKIRDFIDKQAYPQKANIKQYKKNLKQISPECKKKELELRDEMNSYIGSYPVKKGDVISINNLIPHSLQHGIRCIEFQTPVYERLIISFTQKVIRQNHWDTKKAIRVMKKAFPYKQKLKKLKQTNYFDIELICRFKDFKVVRYRFFKNSRIDLSFKTYTLFIAMDDLSTAQIEKKTQLLTAEQGFLLPSFKKITLRAKKTAELIICIPKIKNG